MLVAEFSMSPLDKGVSLSPYVARVVDIVDQSGLDYRLGPMGTCIEGEWEEVFGVLGRCFEALRADCERISIAIKIDYRRGARGRLRRKIESVAEKLGRNPKT